MIVCRCVNTIFACQIVHILQAAAVILIGNQQAMMRVVFGRIMKNKKLSILLVFALLQSASLIKSTPSHGFCMLWRLIMGEPDPDLKRKKHKPGAVTASGGVVNALNVKPGLLYSSGNCPSGVSGCIELPAARENLTIAQKQQVQSALNKLGANVSISSAREVSQAELNAILAATPKN